MNFTDMSERHAEGVSCWCRLSKFADKYRPRHTAARTSIPHSSENMAHNSNSHFFSFTGWRHWRAFFNAMILQHIMCIRTSVILDDGSEARQLDLVRVRAILLITSWLGRLAALQTSGATQMPRVLSKRMDHRTLNNGKLELERRKNMAALRTCESSIHTQVHEAMTKILERPKRPEEARSNA